MSNWNRKAWLAGLTEKAVARSAYPKDIWNAAREAVEQMPDRPPFKSDVELAIAQAIAQERERCAQLVEAMPWWRSTSPDHVQANRPADFASAIRSAKP